MIMMTAMTTMTMVINALYRTRSGAASKTGLTLSPTRHSRVLNAREKRRRVQLKAAVLSDGIIEFVGRATLSFQRS